MCFELMTSYAPPYALRVITVSFGTVASQYAYRSFAPCLMIPPHSCSVPGRQPGTATGVAGGEAGGVGERDEGDVERIARSHEPSGLLGRRDVEHAGKRLGLVADDAD